MDLKFAKLSIVFFALLLLPQPNSLTLITQCGVLGIANEVYELQNDVTSSGTCFVIQNTGITLDLKGHTVTYGNWPTNDILNGGFETGTGTSATGWDFSNASHAQRAAGQMVPPTVAGGNYALRFALGPGTNSGESVVTTQKIHLYPNVGYTLWGSRFGTTGSSLACGSSVCGNVNMVLEIPELPQINFSNGVITSRGFLPMGGPQSGLQPRPFTVPTEMDVTVRVSIRGSDVGSANNAGMFAYVDEIHLKPAMYYGVLSTYNNGATTYKNWYPNDPAPATDRPVHHFTLRNGNIIQGAGAYDHSHGVFLILGQNDKIYNINANVKGIQSEPIKILEAAEYMDIYNNILCNNAQFTKSRDSAPINAISADRGAGGNSIHDNQILCSLQRGIYIPTKNNRIYNNYINISSFYSNNFGIMDPGENSMVYNNIIYNWNGRGIHIEGPNVSVFNNFVWARWSPNQEYPAPGGYTAYGIQLEGASTTKFRIFNNTVFGISDAGFLKGASAFRISADDAGNGPTNGEVFGNSFSAITTNGYEANAIALNTGGNTDGSSIRIYNNILSSNNAIIRYIGGHNTILDSNRFIKLNSPSPAPLTFSTLYFSPYDSINNSLINSTFESGTSSTDAYYYSGLYNNEYLNKWYLTVNIRGLNGNPVSNIPVTVANGNNQNVFYGNSNSQGSITAILTEFTKTRTSTISYNPFLVSVLCNGQNVNLPQTVTSSLNLTFNYQTCTWVSVTPIPSPSISPSPSIIASISPSPSTIASASPSTIPSPSTNPSASPSISPSPSAIPSTSPSPSITPSASPSVQVSPSTSPSASPSIAPCPIEGANRSCLESDLCVGTQYCLSGAWGICIKEDLCCGISCNDQNGCTNDACNAGICSYSAIPGCGGGGGGNSGGGGGFPSLITPSPSLTPISSPSPTILPSIKYYEINTYVKENLPLIENSKDKDEILELLRQAEILQKTGNSQQALVILNRAKTKVQSTIETSRDTKANFTWLLAAFLIIIISGLAIYFVGRQNHRVNKLKIQIPFETKPPLQFDIKEKEF